VEAWNNLKFPEDDKRWVQKVGRLQESVAVEVQKLTEAINNLPKDDLGWNDKIREVTELLESKFTGVGAELLTVTNNIKTELVKLQETLNSIPKDEWKQPLQEAIAAIPKDDTSWKEQIASIKPYDDTPLKEAIANIKPYDDAPLKTSMETLNKTLLENLAQMTQKASLVESKLSTLEADNKTLKEAVEKQQADNAENKKVYELNLAAYEKDIKEYWKPLATQNALEISKLRLDLDGEKEKTKLAESEKKKTLTEMENLQDKQTAAFKAHAKTTVKEPSTVSSFNPYS
jgi:hypothetical protein